ncbi:protein-disulfide isomerase [Streptosporangium album]|uniref:Protein-disulfide isomerase n=1 Tax=Streptosporangium album TaxID=47479 RepID=A0A7W7RTL0_9ACTN|nr:thioredoxin domain-containing protein [Streptosporangium album]MBB4937241.1 protein-disulfide isomerase [Streptosporangium album]
MVIILVTVTISSGKNDGIPANAATPSNLITLRPDGSVVMAQRGVNSPVLEVYEDYQCPYCQEFEQTNGETIKQWATQGMIKVIYYPMTIFQKEKWPVTHDNSHRALKASLCVTDPRKWLAYHDELYDHQPEETAEGGFALKDLVTYAKKVGIDEADFATCLNSRESSDRADAVSALARTRGVEGTPTVRLNGEDIDWSTPWAGAQQRI